MIIATDFDGVICALAYPEIGEPWWPVIEFLRQAADLGHTIILWTCRAGWHLQQAVLACAEWGITLDYVNENAPERIALYGNDSLKISADIYLDDLEINPCDPETLQRLHTRIREEAA